MREDVARMRVCLTRAMLLLERGCRERAFQGFADLYELAAGLNDRASSGKCRDIAVVARSLCYLLDRGQCRDENVLEAVDTHIAIVEGLALGAAPRSGRAGGEVLAAKLRRICDGAQMAPGPPGDGPAAAAR